jgi:signal peptidase I
MSLFFIRNRKKLFEAIAKKFEAKKAHYKRVFTSKKESGDRDGEALESIYKSIESLLEELQEKVATGGELAGDKVTMLKKHYGLLNEQSKPIWQQWVETILIVGSLAFVIRTFIFGHYVVPSGSAETTMLVGDHVISNKWIYLFQPVKRGEYILCDAPEFNYAPKGSLGYYWQRYVGFGIPLLGLPTGPANWTKRVIGLPGDVVEGRIEDGKSVVYVNGEKLVEPYLNPNPLITAQRTTGFTTLSHIGPFAVPGFLRKQMKISTYSYDKNKACNNQPYYNFEPNEILLHPFTGKPIIKEPYEGEPHDTFGPFKVPEGKYWAMGDNRRGSRDARDWGFLDGDLIHGRASFVSFSIDSEEGLFLFDLIKHPIDFWLKKVRWGRTFKIIR